MTDATKTLSKKVLEVEADFGVAFDADGDRAFFVDNQGELLPSFVIASIWFSRSTPPFVVDEIIYLSLTAGNICKEQDIVPTRVGSIFIKEAMQKNDATLGAEFSGHFYFKEFFGLDSGIFSMIYTANILSQQNKTMAQLHTDLSLRHLFNMDIKLNKATWDRVLEAAKKGTSTIAKSTFEREGLTLMTENGWINIRTSHTEPLVRISTEATTKEIAENNLALIAKIIKETDEGS
jgi:phosphomannomutase